MGAGSRQITNSGAPYQIVPNSSLGYQARWMEFPAFFLHVRKIGDKWGTRVNISHGKRRRKKKTKRYWLVCSIHQSNQTLNEPDVVRLPLRRRSCISGDFGSSVAKKLSFSLCAASGDLGKSKYTVLVICREWWPGVNVDSKQPQHLQFFLSFLELTIFWRDLVHSIVNNMNVKPPFRTLLLQSMGT